MRNGTGRRGGLTLRSLIGGLLPFAGGLAFQGGFAVAVMALDRSNRALPSNIGYVLVVECVTGLLMLAALAFRRVRECRALDRALECPLESELPEAGECRGRAWRELALALREDASRRLADRETASREDLESFLSSVHAIKTPATALSLMADRAERTGEPLDRSDVRLEIDELDRILDRTLGRLRLNDFEQGSYVRRVDVAETVRCSVRRHRRLLIARNVAVTVTGSFEAMTDGEWLLFILDQLVSNGAKYAGSAISIILKTDGLTGTIELRDDGPGLDRNDVVRVLGRSASGSAGMSASDDLPASSGYGLYLASEVARRLGIGLELREGPGAAIRLFLPLVLDPLGDPSGSTLQTRKDNGTV